MAPQRVRDLVGWGAGRLQPRGIAGDGFHPYRVARMDGKYWFGGGGIIPPDDGLRSRFQFKIFRRNTKKWY